MIAAAAPGTFAGVDRDAAIGEVAADGVLEPVDAVVKGLAVFDQARRSRTMAVGT
ncbi:MAG: hypothetical protein R3C03_02960 [Pirellulaceae bacterium]